jgi:transcriptional regulator with XRE-family HTH domain
MAESINQRIKRIRETLNLPQRTFASILSLSHSYIASIETNSREVNGRLIKLIVSEFAVNESWLQTGEGAMFSQNPDEKFTKLVSLFKELSPKHQDLVYQIIGILLKMNE